jgi:transposase
VRGVVIDMYEPYIQLIKQCFPNAEIIIDRFHVVQHLNRAMNQLRIQTMKKFPIHSVEYKLLMNASLKLSHFQRKR